MISRRLIRIKIIQVLYSHFSDEKSTIDSSDKQLQQSIKKTYDLYFLLLLIIKVADYAQERIDIASNKILPTDEDLHPNKRFVENKVIQLIRSSSQLKAYVQTMKISWDDYPEVIKKLYQKITETEYYNKYMHGQVIGFEADRQLIDEIYTNEFEGWEYLYQLLEEQSVYWNDDIEFVLSMILKTVSAFNAKMLEAHLLPLYKNDEDKDFGKSLLRKCILKNSEYREIIDRYTKNWEIERIAQIDILIMVAALAEFMEFPSIPIKVTLNEYIDIARFYSTNKSHEFVNGILDKIVSDLQKENKIIKTGRGLLDQSVNG